jgi:UDP-N-acetylglucosamine--N-acetylmuramyl-(pentapeptide) pyrophosphoryl-undecaprenol N-acetylglucosamine transferase
MSRHLVIMAAGTGGHIMPGLAVAQEMRRRGWSVSWLGTAQGMEKRLVPPAGIALDTIAFFVLRGKGLMHTLTGGLRLLGAFWACLKILRRRGASAVLGMGGYVCFPGGVMAALLGKPLVLVNADAALLMSNRALLPVADRICFGFAQIPGQHVRKAVITGNPVRAEVVRMAPPEQRMAGRSGPLQLLVVGGSLGARVLNEVVPQALAGMAAHERPRITHQCGETALEAVCAAYQQQGVDAQVLPFIQDMASALAQADLVVCRAGAITVSELCAAGVASILVPLIVSTTSHQQGNARWLAGQGGAVHLPQAQLNAHTLTQLLRTERTTLLAMAQKARALALPDAAAKVANEIEALAA